MPETLCRPWEDEKAGRENVEDRHGDALTDSISPISISDPVVPAPETKLVLYQPYLRGCSLGFKRFFVAFST